MTQKPSFWKVGFVSLAVFFLIVVTLFKTQLEPIVNRHNNLFQLATIFISIVLLRGTLRLYRTPTNMGKLLNIFLCLGMVVYLLSSLNTYMMLATDGVALPGVVPTPNNFLVGVFSCFGSLYLIAKIYYPNPAKAALISIIIFAITLPVILEIAMPFQLLHP